ncbi:hypothetical protein LP416_15030 [Polaromonas sp. P2-4]|nr:hypothetical protein LP416_15030 [Polaromonas sp. P2-4]
MIENIDLLIEHGTVISMDAQRRVIEDGAVAVRADRIVAVGTTAELRALHGNQNHQRLPQGGAAGPD